MDRSEYSRSLAWHRNVFWTILPGTYVAATITAGYGKETFESIMPAVLTADLVILVGLMFSTLVLHGKKLTD